MKKLLLLITLLFSVLMLWARGSVDAEAEALDIASLTEGKYVWYSEEVWEKYSDKTRVLFFHAAWCPTCRKAQKNILDEYSLLGPDTIVFKIDYDNSSELKQKYGITRQHTFVITDENSEALTTWYGDDTERIAQEVEKL